MATQLIFQRSFHKMHFLHMHITSLMGFGGWSQRFHDLLVISLQLCWSLVAEVMPSMWKEREIGKQFFRSLKKITHSHGKWDTVILWWRAWFIRNTVYSTVSSLVEDIFLFCKGIFLPSFQDHLYLQNRKRHALAELSFEHVCLKFGYWALIVYTFYCLLFTHRYTHTNTALLKAANQAKLPHILIHFSCCLISTTPTPTTALLKQWINGAIICGKKREELRL